jgi:hypothetical protein
VAFCIQCGTDLMVDEARFCPLCGAPQPKLAPRPDEAPAGEAAAPAPKPADPLPRLDLPAYPDEDPAPARSPARSRAARQHPPPDTSQQRPGQAPQPPASSAETPSTEQPQAAPASLPARQAPAAQAAPPEVDTLSYIRRLGRGDHLVGAGTFVLVISLFVTWFDGNVAVRPLGVGSIAGETFIPTEVRTDAFGAGAWHWVLFLLAAALLTYVTARALPGDGIRIPLPHWQLLALASGVQLGLVVLSVLLPPDIGNWSLTYGGYIGLLAAALAFVGAIDRRREPEVLGERPPHHVWPHLHERQAEEGSAAPAQEVAASATRAPAPASVPAPTEQLPSRPLAPPASAPAGPAAPEAGAPDPRPKAPAPKLASRAATRPPAPPAGPAPRTSQPAPAPPPLPRGGSLAPRQGATGRPPARSRAAAEPAPPAETEERPPARPGSSGTPRTRRAQPQPQPAASGAGTEVTCAICSTPNSATARVCRTCGVILTSRPGR